MRSSRSSKLQQARRTRLLSLAALTLCAATMELGSESLTLNSYYPSPMGVYGTMTTTGNTYLARDGGAVTIGNAPTSAIKLNVIGSAAVSGTLYAGQGVTATAGNIWAVNGAVKAGRSFMQDSQIYTPGKVYAADFCVNGGPCLSQLGQGSAGQQYQHWFGCDSETGDSCPPRASRYVCPPGWVITGVTWFEGIGSGISDAGDNIGVQCTKLW